ncbi:MAG: DUF3494 domain-containing protein [Candidatus Harrisonbacteria bacterium]|nr:DUF3494 domain-containing protein [Candidatus Harrisonbacteria bacterium]
MKHYNLSVFAITVYATFAASVAFAASPVPINLGLAGKYAVLAGSGITNSRISTILGNVAISPAGRASIVGLGVDEVTGKIYAADDVTTGVKEDLAQAKSDLAAAYNDAASRTADAVTLSGNIGGQTLAPGLYVSTGALELSSGTLTLDGKGDPNAVWIFKSASELRLAMGRTIAITNGAQAQNVYWQVGTSATIGSGSIFRGIIMADQSIVLEPVVRLDGRALAKNGSVTLAYNNVTEPIDAPASVASAPTVAPQPVSLAGAVLPATPASATALPATASADVQLSLLLAQLAELQKQVAQSETAALAAPAVASGEGVAAPAPVGAPSAITAPVGTVKHLQQFLNAKGFQVAASGAGSPGKETNTFGGLTKKALCKFQVERGIVPAASNRSCGVYGPKTKQMVRDMSQ